MITLDDFKNRGYSITDTSITSPFEASWASKLIQKKFWGDDDQTKYFINVYMTEYDKWDCINRMPESYRGKISYTIKVQFYKDIYTYDITINKDDEWGSVEEIESVVEDVWKGIKCDLDHHN